jgi:hypothetical protein
MKKPLKPTFHERERTHDKFETEDQADAQMRRPDFDELLRAHEEKHDPLNEFTKDSLKVTGHPPTVTMAPSLPDGPSDVTVALVGVSVVGTAGSVVVKGAGASGTVYVLNAKTGMFTTDSRAKRKPSPAKEKAMQADLKRIQAEVEAKHGKLAPGDQLEIRVNTEIEPDPVDLFDGTTRAVAWLPDPKARKMSLKRIADENAELQTEYAEGRKYVIAWRKLWLWVWLAGLFAMPLYKSVKKVPAIVWGWIVWLFT